MNKFLKIGIEVVIAVVVIRGIVFTGTVGLNLVLKASNKRKIIKNFKKECLTDLKEGELGVLKDESENILKMFMKQDGKIVEITEMPPEE